MIRSILPAASGLLLVAACETAPKPAVPDAAAVTADEPAISPRRREPCGEGPAMMLPSDPPRQTGAVTSTGEPIE